VLVVVLCVPALFKYLLGDGTPLNHAGSVDWRWLALIAPGALPRVALAAFASAQPVAVRAVAGERHGEPGRDLQIGLPNGGSQIGQWLIGSGLACHFNRRSSAARRRSWAHLMARH
jgi:uncharacterized membrane protein AbrB (regulator of aidB expression)